MKAEDLYYLSETGAKFYYSTITAISPTAVLIGASEFEASKESIDRVTEGKNKYELLKLTVTDEQIRNLLEQSMSEDVLYSINKATKDAVDNFTADLKSVLSSIQRKLPEISEAISEVSNAVASTKAYKSTVESANRTIESTKHSLTSIEPISVGLSKAKDEFNSINSKLKELFK